MVCMYNHHISQLRKLRFVSLQPTGEHEPHTLDEELFEGFLAHGEGTVFEALEPVAQ
jgi:hypothetical protein